MRLLYLTRGYNGHDARWLRAFRQRGCTVGFLALQEVSATMIQAHHPELHVLRSPHLPVAPSALAIETVVPLVRTVVLDWAPEIVIAGPLTDAGYIAAQILPERTWLLSWAFDIMYEPTTSAAAEKRLVQALKVVPNFLADCHWLLDRAEELAGRPFRRSCVLPWGLSAEDKPAPRRGWRKRLGHEAAAVVLYCRGFSPVQQPLTVIEAFRRARTRRPELRLWVAGRGELEREARSMVQEQGLGEVVSFLGLLDQSDLAGAMTEADIYLSCSLSDGASLSLLQAMHAGLPAVVSDLPGNRETLGEEARWLVPPDRPNGFATALHFVLALSAEDRAALVARLRRRAAEHANWDANLTRLFNALGSVQTAATRLLPPGAGERAHAETALLS